MATQECAGCGCPIESGLLWQPSPTQAQLCCNKRCAARAQRRLQALSSPVALKAPGKKRASRQALASDAVPIVTGGCWGTVAADVLWEVACRLPARELLAAALTCKHWRAQLTRGVSQLDIRVDDLSTPRARKQPLATAVRVVDAAGAMTPHVQHLRLLVGRQCRDPDLVRRHLQAVARWKLQRLRRLELVWEDFEYQHTDDEPEDGNGSPRRRYPMADTQCAAVCPLTLGALGLLTGLESLSVRGAFDPGYGSTDQGPRPCYFGLSSLERLTSLELLTEHAVTMPWGQRDADLSALTALRRLHLSGDLLSPPLLGALTGLTRLEVADLPLRHYGRRAAPDDDGDNDHHHDHDDDDADYLGMEQLAVALGALTELRRVVVHGKHVRYPDSDQEDVAEDCTSKLKVLLGGLRSLSFKQLEEQQNHRMEGRPPAHPGSQSPSPPRRRHRRRRGHRASHASAADGGSPPSGPSVASASPPSAHSFLSAGQTRGSVRGPVAVELRLGRLDSVRWRTEEVDDDVSDEDLEGAARQGCRGAPAAAGAGSSGRCQQRGSADKRGGPTGPLLRLDDELVGNLAEVPGLQRLELCIGTGWANNLHRLGELTRLTHLSICCASEQPAFMSPWDMQRLGSGLRALTHLTLHLPADSLAAPQLGCLLPVLPPGVRHLELVAHTYVRQDLYDWGQVQSRLMRAAPRGAAALPYAAAAAAAVDGAGTGGGEAGRGPCAAASGPRKRPAEPPAWLATEVQRAMQPLLFLQQMVLSSSVEEVRRALDSEAEWRRHQRQQAAERQAAQSGQAAAQQPQLQPQVQAAAQPVQDGDQGQDAGQGQAPAPEATAAVLAGEAAPGPAPESEDVPAAEPQPDAPPAAEPVSEPAAALAPAAADADAPEAEREVPPQPEGQIVPELAADARPEPALEREVDATRATGPADAEAAPQPAPAPALAPAPEAAPAQPPPPVAAAAAGAAGGPDGAAQTQPQQNPRQQQQHEGIDEDTGMPTLPFWVLRHVSWDGPEPDWSALGPDDAAAAGGVGNTEAGAVQQLRDPPLFGYDFEVEVDEDEGEAAAAAAAAAAGAGAAVEAPPPLPPLPPPPPVPLHHLTREELERIRALLVREELVVGPAFKMDSWLPAGVRCLRLRGFAGLELSTASAGVPGGRACQGWLGGTVGKVFGMLEVLDVTVAGGAKEAVEAARALKAWAARDGGRAPRLRAVHVTAAGGSLEDEQEDDFHGDEQGDGSGGDEQADGSQGGEGAGEAQPES